MSLLTKTHSVKTGTMCRSTYNTCFSVHFQRIAFSVDHYKFSCSWNHVVMVHACRQRRVGGRHLDTQPSNTSTLLYRLFAHTQTHTCRWYHGNISRREAKIILQDFRGGNGSFLVRSSESYAGKFAISFV